MFDRNATASDFITQNTVISTKVDTAEKKQETKKEDKELFDGEFDWDDI